MGAWTGVAASPPPPIAVPPLIWPSLLLITKNKIKEEHF
jgi:hypothetical protein